MTRKEAVKAAIKLGLEYSKRVVLTTAVTCTVFVAAALIRPNLYKK